MQFIRSLSVGRLIGLAIWLSSVTAALWIGLVVLVWWVGVSRYNTGWDLWAMLEGLSSAAALGTVLGGGIVALSQVLESVDNRNLAIYNELFTQLMSDEQIEARRWIYLELPADPAQGLASMSEREQARVKLVLNTFDYLGFMIMQHWLTEESVIEWIAPIVVKVWVKLKPYIDYEMERRKDPDYYRPVRYLSERCLAWWHRRHPDQPVVWVQNAL